MSHQALILALRERLTTIADREAYHNDPNAHLARLQAVSEEIERLASLLPQPQNPQLNHFLKNCSYDKALSFLEALEQP